MALAFGCHISKASFYQLHLEVLWILSLLVYTPTWSQDEEERPRPEFAAKAPYLEKNPITGVREPAFPKAVRSDYFLGPSITQAEFQFPTRFI